jgi:hypothetical protein
VEGIPGKQSGFRLTLSSDVGYNDGMIEVPSMDAIPSDGRSLQRYVERKRKAFAKRFGKKWEEFVSEIGPHYWPKEMAVAESIFWCERDFRDYLLINQSIRRRLGWEAIERITTGVPDLTVRVPNCKRLLLVELEFDATNFVKHEHLPLVHLILSFKRPAGFRTIREVPVWSFYQYEWGDPGVLRWSLGGDIRSEKTHGDDFEPEITKKAKRSISRSRCPNCACCHMPIFSPSFYQGDVFAWCVETREKFEDIRMAEDFVRSSKKYMTCTQCGGYRWEIVRGSD